MNLLQIPLDIQLVSTCQSLSVANAARFSQRKDTQFPLYRVVCSSKKVSTLSPTDITPKSLGARTLPTRYHWDQTQCPVHLGHLSRMPMSISVVLTVITSASSSGPSIEFNWDLLLFSSVSFRADGSWRGWLEGGTTLGNFHAHLDYYIL